MMYLEKLEFNKILDKLTNFCATTQGKELAFNLKPSNQISIIENLLQETREAVNLSYRNGYPSFYAISDITIELKKLESNSPLSAKSLLNHANIYK